ncbi:Mce family protein [Mycobacteroides abscessus subsp. bolletii]|uniref:MlaD family protein n=1 Tax=Mycobacteroides abscessus TaxID=36809 RepID=UPI0002D6BC60|nr:MlaD family protein [Mycobacteroides abscessus]SHO89230.1 Mce family protein [Mycobacteroides abscessus subsp. abscessus]SHZ23636.1 Mce family protein [Mycobacteroides abscessus subsp. bolletii]SIE28251.1 Mce family protein [Mycobacteroides abscessus subsp. abscessus]SIH99261.1 Mce family protein [Mycobacteroides abscessus subsp. abscessus]SKP99968.1 Mce family protein [Mycobacteroides abscessus subsp. bolletii]
MNRSVFLVVSIAMVTLVSSCASISVNSLPQPGRGSAESYEIVLEFANVLNLPDRAKVVLDGTAVGTVTRIDLRNDHVDVTSQIDSSVSVPANARATLQQSTVLGDTYLSMERPGTAGVATVGAGGRIPLAQTTSPPQLEDTLANLANFAGSGAVQRAQNTIIGINNVAPGKREDLRAMVSQVTSDLSDLSNGIDTVDTWLDGVSGTVDVVHRNLDVYRYWFSPAGMTGFDRATITGGYIGTVLPSIGSIYSGGFWLVPLLNSLADAVGAVQQTKWDVEAEAPKWRKLFLEDFFPVDKNPAINITSITGPDGREMVNNVQDVLRILGATP